MAFTWNPISVSIGDKITDSIHTKITEIRNNVNTLCDTISISRPTWETLEGKSYPLRIFNIQDEIDRVDDENYCRTDKLSHDSVHDTTKYTGDYTSHHTNACGAAVMLDDTWYYSVVQSYNHIVENSSLCPTNYNGVNTGFWGGACGDV